MLGRSLCRGCGGPLSREDRAGGWHVAHPGCMKVVLGEIRLRRQAGIDNLHLFPYEVANPFEAWRTSDTVSP